MIRKLRVRFIAASMLSLLLVLSVILGILHATNYRGILADADSVLAILTDMSGVLPDMEGDFRWQEAGPRYRSPELPFEIRFFSALLNEDGEVLDMTTDKIYAVDEETVANYAKQAWKSAKKAGFIGAYRFARSEEEEGSRMIFLDCGRNLAAFKSLLWNSVGISLAGMTAVLLLVTLLSGRMIRPVADSYEKQRRFITNAGHEIKTPITIIDADAELLGMELGENEWLCDIQQQTKRLNALTDDLIYLSKMEEQEKPQRIEFPISDVVRETAESFQALARTERKALSIHVQPMLSFCGNAKSIRQLVSILLDNAIKYATGTGEISVTLEKQGRAIRFTVENQAEGISKETLSNMFERFYRAESARNSGFRGYGIGLSVASAIVSAHKGKISATMKDANTLHISVMLPC